MDRTAIYARLDRWNQDCSMQLAELRASRETLELPIGAFLSRRTDVYHEATVRDS